MSSMPVSVLVVDDDPDIRYAFKDIIESEGFTVETAANGREALERLRGCLPRLILLDLSMPIMSGREFRAAQVLDPLIADIPTVVVTAAGRYQQMTADLNVDAMLHKPVSLEDLIGIVSRYAS